MHSDVVPAQKSIAPQIVETREIRVEENDHVRFVERLYTRME
jgi:hypothetical protein